MLFANHSSWCRVSDIQNHPTHLYDLIVATLSSRSLSSSIRGYVTLSIASVFSCFFKVLAFLLLSHLFAVEINNTSLFFNLTFFHVCLFSKLCLFRVIVPSEVEKSLHVEMDKNYDARTLQIYRSVCVGYSKIVHSKEMKTGLPLKHQSKHTS